MSVEWVVALVVFAVVGVLWFTQRGDAPYRRAETRASKGSRNAGA